MRKTNFLKNCFFFPSGILNEIFMPYGKTQLSNFFKTSLNVFVNFFALWAKCSETFRVKKQNSTCPEDQFLSCNFEISRKLYFFCTYREKQFVETFWQTCQTCTCFDQNNNLRENFSLKIYFFLEFGIKILCLMAKEAYEVVKTSFYVSRRSFFSLKRLENAQMFGFVVLTAKMSLREHFGTLVKSIRVLSTVTFWGKLVL